MNDGRDFPLDDFGAKIFAKPRFGAYGEDCMITTRMEVEQTFSAARTDFMLFEELLRNCE